jgi:hypothetical protein
VSSDFALNEQTAPARFAYHGAAPSEREDARRANSRGALQNWKEILVMSYFHIPMKLVAAAAVAFAIGAAVTPANAALTINALTASGSAIDDLNGVTVEAATAPEEKADHSRSGRQDGTVAPGALAFEPKPIPPGSEDW